ncbi:MAG: choice-of-anchor D domain-containing protein [Thermotogae bacterium]|nr:choice-of-anchor D domain-containing protein [Thermotogota bacterium]
MGGFVFILLLISLMAFGNTPLIQQTGDQQNPQVLYITNGNYYLLIWEDWRNPSDADIYGQFFREDGTPCSAEFPIARGRPGDSQTHPHAVYAPDQNLVLVVWQDTRFEEVVDQQGNTRQFWRYIYYTTFRPPADCTQIPTMNPEDGAFIDFTPVFDEELTGRFKPRVSYNNSLKRFVIVWVEKRSQTKRASGTWNACQIQTDNNTTKSVSFDLTFGDNTFVGYVELNTDLTVANGPGILNNAPNGITTSARFITENDITVSPGLNLVFEHIDSIDNVDVSCDYASSSCLIVFQGVRHRTSIFCGDNGTIHRTDTFPDEDALVHVFATTLDQFRAVGNLLTRVDVSTAGAYNPSVGNDPVTGRFLVVWEDLRDNETSPNVYGQLLGSSGIPYAENFVVSYTDQNQDGQNDLNDSAQTSPEVVYDSVHQRFLVLWQDSRNAIGGELNLDLFGQFVGPEGSLQGDNQEITLQAVGNQLAPAGAYNPNRDEFFIVWKDTRNQPTTGSDIYAVIRNLTVQDTAERLRFYDANGRILVPLVLDFGKVAVNDALVRTVFLRNDNTVDVALDCITITGESFSFSSPIPAELVTCQEGQFYTLRPGESLRLDIAFSPAQEVYYQGFLEVRNDSFGLVKSLRLTGNGINNPLPELQIIEGDGTDDGTLAFGEVTSGNTAVRTLILRNTGNVTLVLDLSLSNDLFTMNSFNGTAQTGQALRIELLPGEQAFLYLYFDSEGLLGGRYEATLSVTSANVIGLIRTITLTVDVVSPVIVEITEGDGTNDGILDLGRVNTDEVVSQHVVVTNQGNSSVTLVATTSTSYFTVNPVEVTIPPGGQEVISVSFNAEEKWAGTYEGRLTLTSKAEGLYRNINLTVEVVENPAIRVIEGDNNDDGVLDFGNVTKGDTVRETITVVNTGNVPLTIYPSTTNENFTLYIIGTRMLEPSPNPEPFNLNPGEQRQIDVVFNSADLKRGTYSGEVRIITNKAGVASSVEVIAQVLAPLARIDRTTLDFGSVKVGEFRELTVTIFNDGDARLNIDSCGQIGEGFQVVSCPVSVEPGLSQQIIYRFVPTYPKEYQTTITVTTNGGNVDISLKGLGLAGLLQVTPAVLDFGTVGTNQTSILGFTIENKGTDTLRIEGIDTINLPPVYSINTPLSFPLELGPGQGITLDVSFSPGIEGVYLGEIVVNSDAVNGPQKVLVQGVASPVDVRVEPLTIDFGSVPAGTEVLKGISVTNKTSKPVKILGISRPAEPFGASYSFEVPYELGPGEKVNIVVSFIPPKAGVFTSALSILFDYSSEPQVVLLSGTATAQDTGEVTIGTLRILYNGVDVSFVNFGEVLVGKTAELTLELRNDTPNPIDVADILVDYPFEVYVKRLTIEPNTSKTIAVRFTPPGVGRYTGVLTLKDARGNEYKVNLIGYGTPVEVSTSQGVAYVSEDTTYYRVEGGRVEGAFRFEVTEFQGDTVDITLVFAETLPPDAVIFKYLGGENFKQIYPTNECDGITNVSFTGNTLSFTIRDNSECDLSPETGRILDPVIVVSPQPDTGDTTATLPVTAAPSVGGGGGCSTAPVKDFGMLGYLLPLLIPLLRRFKYRN